jgi:hypothetical protein
MPPTRQSFWLDAKTNDGACPQSGPRRGPGGPSVAFLAIVAALVVAGSGRVHAQEEPLGEATRRLERRLDELERDNKAIREENARLLQQKNATPPATEKDIGGAATGLKLPALPPVPFQPDAPSTPTIPEAVQPPPAPNPAASGRIFQSLGDQLATRYDGGFVLVESQDPESTPYKLVVKNFAQVRFTNTQLDSLTYVDHLGNVRPVDPRNDFSLNRDLLTFSGYVFSPKMQYNFIVWSSGSLGDVVFGGWIDYEFCKEFKLYGGYNGMPGSRSLIGNFKDLQGMDRSMADTFFRPGFTQGIWATGEPLDNLFYHVMIGNSLNTLAIPTAKIDTNLAYSGSVWWEPLGSFGPGEASNDLERQPTPVVRLGSSYTHAREDRFSDSEATTPDNTQIHNSDGTLFFATGSLAPGVTVQLADYNMWAVDAGLKYQGLALNGQYFFRTLTNFRADGPLPLSSEFDHGFEASAGYFFFPKLEFYARTSFVFGQFGNSDEYGGGFNWYPFANRGLRINGEAGRLDQCPVGNIITPYSRGATGIYCVLQAHLNF